MAQLYQDHHEFDANYQQTNGDDKSADKTPMAQFFAKKTIFMTGGTGFLGKVTIEKILRSCDVEAIYLLIRTKKGKEMHSRLEDIFEDPLFEKLKEQQPKFRTKIHGIAGDCCLPDLGISEIDQQALCKNVNIVFHVAATVRFDEKMKLALSINVNATSDIVALCRRIDNLQALIHVSTAYANCNQTEIDEKFYKPRIGAQTAIKLNECMDAEFLDEITPQLIKSWPNTYTMTKCLAEDVIRTHTKGLPVAIFRPAIVIPTYREPIAGWVDNFYGPTGIIAGTAAGLLRVLHLKESIRAELVPVDFCVNAMLAIAWDLNQNTYDEPPIYNYTTNKDNPITWREYCDLNMKHGMTAPLQKSIWYTRINMVSSKFLANICMFFYHIIPAFLMDLGLIMMGKKTRLLPIYKKIHRFSGVLEFFITNQIKFENHAVRQLWQRLDSRDQNVFYFNMSSIDWIDYIALSIRGMRIYLLKDKPSTIPASIKKMAKLKILHYSLIYTIYTILMLIVYLIISKFMFEHTN